MNVSRRSMLKAAAGCVPFLVARHTAAEGTVPAVAPELERIASEAVLRLEGLREPVVLESMELLLNGREIVVRARSKGGVRPACRRRRRKSRRRYSIPLA